MKKLGYVTVTSSKSSWEDMKKILLGLLSGWTTFSSTLCYVVQGKPHTSDMALPTLISVLGSSQEIYSTSASAKEALDLVSPHAQALLANMCCSETGVVQCPLLSENLDFLDQELVVLVICFPFFSNAT